MPFSFPSQAPYARQEGPWWFWCVVPCALGMLIFWLVHASASTPAAREGSLIAAYACTALCACCLLAMVVVTVVACITERNGNDDDEDEGYTVI